MFTHYDLIVLVAVGFGLPWVVSSCRKPGRFELC